MIESSKPCLLDTPTVVKALWGSLHTILYALRKDHCYCKHMQCLCSRKTSNEASGVLAHWEVRLGGWVALWTY